MNYKRGKSRKQVRCTLCTDNRENIGGDRQKREHEAFMFELTAESSDPAYAFCPDCDGTGRCDCETCMGACVLCDGTGVYT